MTEKILIDKVVLQQMVDAQEALHKARLDYALSDSPVISAKHEALNLRVREALHNVGVCTDALRQALYTRPQPAAWVGLTLEDRQTICDKGLSTWGAAVATEAMLREKNTGESK